MSSKIEQQIDAIEEYIGDCKYATFSKTNIIVDKDEMLDLLDELHRKRSSIIRESSTIRKPSSTTPAKRRRR